MARVTSRLAKKVGRLSMIVSMIVGLRLLRRTFTMLMGIYLLSVSFLRANATLLTLS